MQSRTEVHGRLGGRSALKAASFIAALSGLSLTIASGARAQISDDALILGPAFTINGTTYTPADAPKLDEVGRLHIRTPEEGAGATASGEPYVATAVSAAHRTLPLPSYAEVTSLSTGRTILVRITDRGPMNGNFVIGLSPGAAAQLGEMADNAPVRVRRVSPPDQERATLRAGSRAAERLESPAGLRSALLARLHAQEGKIVAPSRLPQTVTPVPVPASNSPVIAHTLPTAQTSPFHDDVVAGAGADFSRIQASRPEPVASPQTAVVQPIPVQSLAAPVVAQPAAPPSGRYAVQIAALASRANADALAGKVSGFVTQAGSLHRVRTGPYRTQAEAQAAATKLQSGGFPQARPVVNDGR